MKIELPVLAVRLTLQAWQKMGRNTRYVLILGSGSAAELYLTVVTALITEQGVQESIESLYCMGKGVAVLLDDIVTKVARSRPVDFGGLSMVMYDSYPRRPW